jgi:Flp pilus assembly protein TadG
MVALTSTKSKRRAGGFLRCDKLRSFAKQQDGVVAIEFGLVLAPFLAMLFAILETAMVFFAGQTLETAAADSARLILTGQAQTQGLTQASYKDAVCARIFGLFDCANGIKIDVKKYTSFASVDLSKPVDASGKLKTTWSYDPGGPCEIVVVRLVYEFPVYVSLMGFDLADMSGGKRLLIATSVFRNEPYQGTCS